ncbi:unnamed protein product [Phytophthora fragariaefolia]|uniref:Unnamed protein product n=1 Tax=Phytophthora fragariaefolia TaxID=1490495 RepID=A0A9W7D3Z9_9STRA|nr:unnamed protein product [Phytophthora fragariaefolia]
MSGTVWRRASFQTNGCSVRPEPACSAEHLEEAGVDEECPCVEDREVGAEDTCCGRSHRAVAGPTTQGMTPASTKCGARAKSRGAAVGTPGTPRVAPRAVQLKSAAPVNPIALTHAVSNAVKVLRLFHSAGVTVEKARDFWEAFEDTTNGLPDRFRLLVFRQKIKGSQAERWWNNLSIKTFETLKIRFHNHFLSRTADALWERTVALDQAGARRVY